MTLCRVRIAPFAALSLVLAFAGMGCWLNQEGPRRYPFWIAKEGRARLEGCAEVDAWVAKSGKEGIGLALEVRGLAASEQPCRLEIAKVTISIGDQSFDGSRLPAAALLARGDVVHAYVPVPFDGDAAWNAGERAATIVVSLRDGGALRFAFEQTIEERTMCEEHP
jgi:hypothetical protein